MVSVLLSVKYCHSNTIKVTLKVTMGDCLSIIAISKVSGISVGCCVEIWAPVGNFG